MSEESKPKGPGGRPTDYRPEYCQKMVDFFDRDYTQEKHGKIEACDFPSIAGFARKLKVTKQTLYNWGEKHPPFFDVLEQCRGIQEDILISNALKGSYSAPFTQFLLKNTHGFKDKQDIQQTSELKVVIDDDESKL